MKAKFLIPAVMMCTVLALSGCGRNDESTETETAAKIVKAEPVAEQSIASGYSYIGIVKAKETKNYSFLASGKIEKIYVEKGQKFKAGDTLAKLDTTSMEHQSSIGKNTTDQAKAALDKTISTYDTNIANAKSQISTLDKQIAAGETGIEALEKGLEAEQTNIDAGQTALDTLKSELEAAREINAAGGIADKDLDSLESTYTTKSAELDAAKATFEGDKAELESKKADLDAAKAQKAEAEKTLANLNTSKAKDVATAQAALKSAQDTNAIADKALSDAVIKADSDGYVMELPFKDGEVVSAGYPVIVAKSTQLVVTVGASDEEYKNISVGGTALINGTDRGTIQSIAQYPDENTRTYSVDIGLNGDYTIGETVDVKIVTGSVAGCYVPIDAIFNSDGVDYVYAINNENRIYKKQVVLGDFNGDEVEIQIDDPTAVVVTEGIKNLRENDLVKTEG